jgi:hypothetical protein
MKELSREEKTKIATELENRYEQSIASNCDDLYREQPAAIGVALACLSCECLLLRAFDQDGTVISEPRILKEGNACGIDHANSLNGITESTIYGNILWRDTTDEFDRKFGNEKRVDLAGKLFPPQVEEEGVAT